MLKRLAAFTDTPDGGNPAGVWIGDTHPDTDEMQRIAAQVGFSETAFIAPASGSQRRVRYFSPAAEVPFCGHATIASGAVLGRLDGAGEYRFDTQAGAVIVDVDVRDGHSRASLISAEPQQAAVDDDLLDEVLGLLRWSRSELDASIPPVRAYAGAWHLVIAAGSRQRLEQLDYAFDELAELSRRENLVTLQLVWRERPGIFHARNPFPFGGVVEDPATGAAAAALGGYLRDAGLVDVPASLTIYQGATMGRPSQLDVDIPPTGGIRVSGSAVELADEV